MKKSLIRLCWLLWLVNLATVGSAEEAELILFENFETPQTSGLYARLVEHDRLSIAENEGVGGTTALKASYVGYDRGSRRIVLRHPLSQRGREFTLAYDVKFDRDFQFVRGGKLHGLGPDRPITGGNEMTPTGWSARVVFRRGGGVGTYLYCHNKPGRYGAGVSGGDFRFQRGRFYAVSLHVRLNDPDEENGLACIYVDGQPIVQHENVRYRTAGGEESLLSQLLISTFHGGSSPAWAPRDEAGDYTTVHAYFDNLAVYRGERIRAKPGE